MRWGTICTNKKILQEANLKLGESLSIFIEQGKIILNPIKVLLNCHDCGTEMEFIGMINGYYEYRCPECSSIIRVNNKRH